MLAVTQLAGFAGADISTSLAYVGLVGSPASASTSGTSLAITVPSLIPAGETLLVGGTCKVGFDTFSVNDSRSNSYPITVAAFNDGTRAACILAGTLATALQAGDVVTLYYPGAGGSARTMIVWRLTGGITGTHQEDDITSSVNNFTMSIAGARGFCVYATHANQNSETNTPPAGWTEDYDINGIGGAVSLGHKDVLVEPAATTACIVTRSGTSASMAIAGSLV